MGRKKKKVKQSKGTTTLQWPQSFSLLHQKRTETVLDSFHWLLSAPMIYKEAQRFSDKMRIRITQAEDVTAIALQRELDVNLQKLSVVREDWEIVLARFVQQLHVLPLAPRFGQAERREVLLTIALRPTITSTEFIDVLLAFQPFLHTHFNSLAMQARAQKKVLPQHSQGAALSTSWHAPLLGATDVIREKCGVCRANLSSKRCTSCYRWICPRCGTCSTRCDARHHRRENQAYGAFKESSVGLVPEERWIEMKRAQKETVGRAIDFDVDPRTRSRS
ncbi:hypothetical protein [Deinococcus hopiensis]|uniref:Uncharacterized protein n=1 Tax=Deinococcus hopiensis KR-140 TaxID=695939 RepID=A0A1W1ULM5_9DEIO|nr:hypothetical protein [Deinococcus hopiensis]SMB81960.1 hypothetical protein SAMN00790413_04791 [Deinococcus hopiensis KR-140]